MRRLCRAAIVVLVFLAVGACAGPQLRTQEAHPRKGQTWCETRGAPVVCIGGPGRLRAIVYLGNADSQDLVLWDPGGPGLGLPGPDTSLAEILPRAIRDRNVLLVVEPWYNRHVPAECLKSAFHGVPGRSCGLTSLVTTPSAIRGAVRAAEAETGRRLVGAYLQSFGATRTLPVLLGGHGPEPRWVVLESPAPPPGTSALTLMRARTRALTSLVTKRCRNAECSNKIRRAMLSAARHGAGARASGREIALGLVALATDPFANHAFLRRISIQLQAGAMKTRTVSRLVLVGRRYEGKRAHGRVAKSTLGLWADTCPRLTGWRALRKSDNPIIGAFGWVFRGCRSLAGTKTMRMPERWTRATPRFATLMLMGRHDAVVPPELQRSWSKLDKLTTRTFDTAHVMASPNLTRHVRRWIADQERGR